MLLYVLMALAALVRGGSGLILTDASGRQLAFVHGVKDFRLEYFHSIHLSPVVEEFSLEGDTLVLEGLLYGDPGGGLPSMGRLEPEDLSVHAARDGLLKARTGLHLTELRVHVGASPQQLVSDLGRYPLTRWAPPGGLLILRATP